MAKRSRRPRPEKYLEWSEIAEHTLTLCGDGASITLTTDTVLALPDCIDQYDAVAFKVTVQGDARMAGRWEHRSLGTYYGRLDAVLQDFQALRLGQRDELTLPMLGFHLRIHEPRRSGHHSHLVEGIVDSMGSAEAGWPWPDDDDGVGRIVERDGFSTCFRFAFLMSKSGPLDEFVAELNELVSHLRLYGDSI